MLSWFKPNKPLSAIRRMIDSLDNRTIVAFNPYSSDKSLQTITTLFDTVIAYRKALIDYHKYMLEDMLIPQYRLSTANKVVYLRDFFTHEAKFIDVNNELLEFYKACRAFLDLYETLEQQIDKSFNTEKNLLLLQHTVSNLLILLESCYA